MVDIRGYGVQPLPAYIVDANILVFTRYDRYDQERQLKKDYSPNDRLDLYSAYEARARAAGSSFHVPRSSIFEFLRTIEIAELHIILAQHDSNAANGNLSNFNPKKVRELYPTNYYEAQKRIITYLEALTKQFQLVESAKPFINFTKYFSQVWLNKLVDSGDALLAADSISSGITNILSDDADIAKLEGITLFTANRIAIEAARKVGRLVTS